MSEPSKQPDRGTRTVTVTFKTRADKHLLDRAAELEGVSPSTLARTLILRALAGDPVLESLTTIEERLELLHRHLTGSLDETHYDVQQGVWMLLKALEDRASGASVKPANDWIREKMDLLPKRSKE